MEAAWFFIATAWLISMGIYASIFIADDKIRTAFPVATEIAEAGDWDFLSFAGWKDRFPDAKERLAEIQERHSKVFIWTQAGPNEASHEVARQIASNRP